jgi:hypothetical protein
MKETALEVILASPIIPATYLTPKANYPYLLQQVRGHKTKWLKRFNSDTKYTA